MKLEFQNRWVRLVFELFPRLTEFRRYRVSPPRCDGQTGRRLRRRIARTMRMNEPGAAG